MKINYTWNFIDGNQSDFIYDENKIQFNEDSISLINPLDTTMPYIINVEGIEFTFLTKTSTIYSSASSGSCVKFQLSNDNENWYYYENITKSWADSSLTSTISGSNYPEELTTSALDNFALQIDSGKLYYKMFFITDGITNISVAVQSINLQANKYYTTVKEIRALMSPYGLRAIDPISGCYIEAEDFLSDTKLKAMIPLADAYINNATYTDFYLHRNVVEYYDGNGKDSLRTYNYPITKITHVIMYNPLMQAMRTFLDFELIIHPEWGEIFLPPIYPAFMSDAPARAMFGNIFMNGRRNIEVAYDWGTQDTPEDINLAAQKYVGMQIMNAFWAFLTRGTQSRSFDGYSESYGQKPFSGIVDQWQKEIKDVIQTKIKYFPRSI